MSEKLGVTTQDVPVDNLIAGDHPIIQEAVVIVSGAGELKRGAVLGRIDLGAATPSKGTNTGDATIATATLAANAQAGAYKLRCIKAPSDAAANDAEFSVFAPDGSRLADAVQGVAYAGGHLVFTIPNATAVDSVIGDTFTVTVAAGSGQYKAYNPANLDGSNMPRAILARNVDASEASVKVNAYVHGEFTKDELTGIDAAGITKLKTLGIFVKNIN